MRYFVLIFGLFLINCTEKKKNKDQKVFPEIIVDKNLVKNDTILLLSKFPELKLYSKEIVESKTRTAYVVQNSKFGNFLLDRDNYKCKAQKKDDTLEISVNNYDGMTSNGIVIKVFGNHFFVKDYDPQTLRGEIKFINAKPESQALRLDKINYQKNDSLFGFVDYQCNVKGGVIKSMRGYFKTKIQ